MSTDVAVQSSADLLERVVVGGDLSKLAAGERMTYYKRVCESLGLNPLTRPFGFLTLNSRLVLYAHKECTDQLRTLHDVSIVPPLENKVIEGVYVVTAYAKNGKGRTDTSTGAVSIEGMKGEALANAMMKAESKAKRRVTLSICGLGMLDESEVDSIPGAMVGEPPATSPSVDDADRHRFLDVIDARSRELGLTKREYKDNWHRYMGNVVTERAQIADLMQLADELATQLATKKKNEAEVKKKAAEMAGPPPEQESVPF